MENQKKIKTFIVIGMVIIIVLMVFIVAEFSRIRKEGTACISSPFVWGARKVAEEGEDISCTCMSSKGNSFSFNKEGMNFQASYNIYGGVTR